MSLPPFVTPSGDAVLVDAFVRPGAGKDSVAGVHGAALRVKVKAPPVDGRANAAVEELLARLLRIPRRDVEVVAGTSSRHKRIAVRGLSPEVVARELSGVLSSRAHEPGQEAR